MIPENYGIYTMPLAGADVVLDYLSTQRKIYYHRENFADTKGQAYLKNLLISRINENPQTKDCIVQSVELTGKENRQYYDMHSITIENVDPKQLAVIKKIIAKLNAEIPDKGMLVDLVAHNEKQQKLAGRDWEDQPNTPNIPAGMNRTR